MMGQGGYHLYQKELPHWWFLKFCLSESKTVEMGFCHEAERVGGVLCDIQKGQSTKKSSSGPTEDMGEIK